MCQSSSDVRHTAEKLEYNPETFKEPVRVMYRTFQTMTDNNMVSAMFMFWKYSTTNELGSPQVHWFIIKITRTKRFCTTNCNCTTESSRWGRRRLTSGKPTKDAAVTEHGYLRTRSECVLGMHWTKRFRIAAPHSLSHATIMNVALGKTHGAQ